MSLYAARARVAAVFTAAAVNAQIGILETLYGVTVPDVGAVGSGAITEPSNDATQPELLYRVGVNDLASGAGMGQGIKSQGVRDDRIPLAFFYYAKKGDLAALETDIGVTLEALRVLLETLEGTALGATQRGIVQVTDVQYQVGRFDVAGAAQRLGGVLACQLWVRAEGV